MKFIKKINTSTTLQNHAKFLEPFSPSNYKRIKFFLVRIQKHSNKVTFDIKQYYNILIHKFPFHVFKEIFHKSKINAKYFV